MKSAVFILLLALPLTAHPDPRHTLEHLDEHLQETPDKPELLSQKAALLIDTDHPDLARPVIARLLELAPAKPEYLLLDAQVTLEERNTAAALAKTTALVAAHPEFVPGLKFLSRVEEESGNREGAIDAMQRCLALAPNPSPSDVMTCAAWLRERAKPGDTEAAISLLDQGLAKLGVLSGLHYEAIELELGLGRYDSALRRIDALTARFRPSIDLSLRRADILEKAGRYREAAGALDSALALLDLLPAKRKQTPEFKSRFEEITLRKQADSAKSTAP